MTAGKPANPGTSPASRNHFRGKSRPGRRVDVDFAPPGGDLVRAHTRNLGLGGAFIVTPSPPSSGTWLRLLLHLPTAERPLEVRAEVRWLARQGGFAVDGMGVRFDGLGVDEVVALNLYFASLTGSEDGGDGPTS